MYLLFPLTATMDTFYLYHAMMPIAWSKENLLEDKSINTLFLFSLRRKLQPHYVFFEGKKERKKRILSYVSTISIKRSATVHAYIHKILSSKLTA